MRKIDYEKLNWEAKSNWEFCGSYENLREVWERYWECIGIRVSIEEFGYKFPYKGLAFKKGDIVKYTSDDGEQSLGVVDTPVGGDCWFIIRLSSGNKLKIYPGRLNEHIAPAGIPEELVALARAEAGKPIDFSKCPLKDPGACMKGGEA
jgi:hypothetical protein